MLLAIVIIGDGVMHIQEGYQLLDNLIEDEEIAELFSDADQYVPLDVSEDIKIFIDQVNSLWEPISTASDSSLQFLKTITSEGLM